MSVARERDKFRTRQCNNFLFSIRVVGILLPEVAMKPVDIPRRRLLEILYSQHHGWLNNWLRKKLGCPQRAADLAQDTFMRVLLLEQPEQLREPRAFLTTTASRLIIDRQRRRKLEDAFRQSVGSHFEEGGCTLEHLHEVLETLEAIAALLDGLPERVREAFLLSRLQGLNHEQIAARLGISKSSVKNYITQVLVHCYGVLHGGQA